MLRNLRGSLKHRLPASSGVCFENHAVERRLRCRDWGQREVGRRAKWEDHVRGHQHKVEGEGEEERATVVSVGVDGGLIKEYGV